VEIDKRASLSISPSCDDFLGEIQPFEINALNGLLYMSCKLVMDQEGFCPKKCNKPSTSNYPTSAGASSCKAPICAACQFEKQYRKGPGTSIETNLHTICSIWRPSIYNPAIIALWSNIYLQFLDILNIQKEKN